MRERKKLNGKAFTLDEFYNFLKTHYPDTMRKNSYGQVLVYLREENFIEVNKNTIKLKKEL